MAKQEVKPTLKLKFILSYIYIYIYKKNKNIRSMNNKLTAIVGLHRKERDA